MVAQAKATNATYNEFQALKSGVLQQSSEIVRQSETMLELIKLMKETCATGALDKPAKHIMVSTDFSSIFFSIYGIFRLALSLPEMED